jgi:hypothetical protein
MSPEKGTSHQLHGEISKTLLESGAVNFDAIGAALAKFGPRFSTVEDDGWESFCTTMKIFLRLYRFPPWGPMGPLGIDDLTRLRETISADLHTSS